MLENRFINVRQKTEALCSPLENEDLVIQSMPEVSPPKWHLGHTTWFLEELILNKRQRNYKFYQDNYRKIFNSYYKGLGEHWNQSERGRLSRPGVNEVKAYRKAIDEILFNSIEQNKNDAEFMKMIELAIHHEQQHQELLLMDVKNILGTNPMLPAYQKNFKPIKKHSPEKWIEFPEGVYEIGSSGKTQFAFDNETPVHKVYLNSFAISDHLVTNGEYLHFIQDKGYSQPKLWLSKGWDWVQQNNITAPLYWSYKDKEWSEFTLYGQMPLDLSSPVSHINYFEADAFAKWMNMRLPTEAEFEVCAHEISGAGENKMDKDKLNVLHPENAKTFDSQLWCWTRSHYSPYPGFSPFEGAIEEYNGKFMCNQFILRGGCFATPEGHYRRTYRNFYEPEQRWMFSGIALAKDC
jgi:ergothioneine biosynthesis protein EgtB